MTLRQLLKGLASLAPQEPDFSDLIHRSERRARRRRVLAGGVGLGVAALGLVLTLSLASRTIIPNPAASPSTATVRPPEATDRPPEGQLLLIDGTHGVVIDADGSRHDLPEGLIPYEFTPDGLSVLMARREGGVVSHRQSEAVLYNVTTGQQVASVSAGADGRIGQVELSPDGLRIAYVRASGQLDTQTLLPAVQTLCLADLVGAAAGAPPQCFGDLHPTLGFGWSPDGSRIVVTGTGSSPVRVVTVATGAVQTLSPPGGNDSVREGLASRDLGEIQQFSQPRWSQSGAMVAFTAAVVPGGSVPMILSASDGSLVALGEENGDSQQIAWSPTQDVLAYSTGVNGPGPFGQPHPPAELHVLNPGAATDSVVHELEDLEGRVLPAILEIVWSPSGQWLGVQGTEALNVVSSDGSLQATDFRLDPDAGQSLVDWGT